jgi:hypothetical protein
VSPQLTALPQHLDAHPLGACVRTVLDLGCFSVGQVLNALAQGHKDPDSCVAWILEQPDASLAPPGPVAGMPAGGGEREAKLCLALREQGLPWDEAQRRATQACLRTTSPDVALQMALGLCEARPEATVYDRVGMEEAKVGDTFLVECTKGHRFVYDTIFEGIKFHLSEGRVPCCPEANAGPEHGCGYTLSQGEIEQVSSMSVCRASTSGGPRQPRS